jgi:coenzyme PQQ biosynthesis protein C
VPSDADPFRSEEFEARLHAIGTARHHDEHPFNPRMHAGKRSRAGIQAWARDGYYCQTRIPVKDRAILTKSCDPVSRHEWVQRHRDPGGRARGEGGPARWLRLTATVRWTRPPS